MARRPAHGGLVWGGPTAVPRGVEMARGGRVTVGDDRGGAEPGGGGLGQSEGALRGGQRRPLGRGVEEVGWWAAPVGRWMEQHVEGQRQLGGVEGRALGGASRRSGNGETGPAAAPWAEFGGRATSGEAAAAVQKRKDMMRPALLSA
jgi:hypothetical protein